jgi:C4-dicarboxylate-specific signal transduction histidine kinase
MIRAENLASLGTLSATLAHELTQPLTVIRLSIQNALEILERTACPETVAADLQDGLAEISHAMAIVGRFGILPAVVRPGREESHCRKSS